MDTINRAAREAVNVGRAKLVEIKTKITPPPSYEQSTFKFRTSPPKFALPKLPIIRPDPHTRDEKFQSSSHEDHTRSPVSTTLTPYIGLSARLSQLWINPLTVVLLLFAVKVALFRASFASSFEYVHEYAINSCQSADIAASNIAVMPHYLAKSANSLIDTSMTTSIRALISGLDMIITGLEALFVFYIEFLVGTYACLVVSLIDGVVDVAVNATESVINFINDDIGDIVTSLDKGLDQLSNVFNDVAGFVSDIQSVFTGEEQGVKSINMSIASLKNIQIPSSINEKLTSLRDNMPTYDDVKNDTISLINVPFDLIKKELGVATSKIYFNSSMLNVPSKDNKNISFCSVEAIDNISSTIQHLVSTGCIAFIVILVALAILVWAPLAYKEVTRWKWINQCARTFEGAVTIGTTASNSHLGNEFWADGNQPSSFLDTSRHSQVVGAIEMANAHWKIRIQNLVCRMFFSDSIPDKQILVRWFIDYVTQPRALAVLGLGLSGILCAGIQRAIISRAIASAPELKDAIIDGMSALSQSINSDIDTWVSSANTAINATQDSINNDLLGWVSKGAASVNTTLTKFLDDMNSDIVQTFGSTPLYGPMSTVVKCLVGNKIEQAIKGLTWVHDQAHVEFPTINKNILLDDFIGLTVFNSTMPSTNSTASPSIANSTNNQSLRLLTTQRTPLNTTSSISSGMSVPALDKVAACLERIIGAYISMLNTELLVSGTLLAAWIVLCSCGYFHCARKWHQLKLLAVHQEDRQFASKSKEILPPPPGLFPVSPLPVQTARRRHPPPPPIHIFRSNSGPDADWSFKGFNPPSSFLAADQFSRSPSIPTQRPSPTNSSPLPTPTVTRYKPQAHINVKHPSVLRKSSVAHLT